MKEMNKNKQTRDILEMPTTKKSKKENSCHLTQKLLALLEKVILASSNPGAI